MPINTLRPLEAADCSLVRHLTTLESPLINELVAVTSHLERAQHLAGTPAGHRLPHGGTVPTDRMSQWVIGNLAQIRHLLAQITDAHPAQQPAELSASTPT
ncbi:hypothetical protein [Streptomyces sp. NBC_01465]|uniref:hypothetical protein n=1 Tax=Streptomyces sp. NBC_01465 TaxID=2903878 RepID=UPI002E344B98|nr:hypothetical protein [Streptomyces sp. NBC_01465]